MRDREHPHPDLLLRFLLVEASKSENRVVVRHLLSGCALCNATIQKNWQLPEEIPRQRRHAQASPLPEAKRFQVLRGRRA